MSEEQKLRKHIGVGYAGRVAKAAFVGIAALTAGVSADAHVGTALVSPDGGNATELHEKGFSNLSNQTDLGHSLRNVTLEELKQMGVKNPERFLQNRQKLEQNLQQREQKRAQRQEMRRLVEEAQKNPEVLKSLRKLFEEIPGKESSETDRRKLGIPVTPGACLQWDTASTVIGTVIPVEGGGTALGVDYNLNVQNTCSDTINNVQYQIIETGTCPSGCAKTTVGDRFNIPGVPNSIDQGGTSRGIKYEPVVCQQIDANGGQTPVAPDSFSVTAQPFGWQKSNTVWGGLASFPVYPST